MDDFEISIEPNQDDMALDTEGRNVLCTSISQELQECILLCNDDPSSQHSLDKNEDSTVPLSNQNESGGHSGDLEEGEYTSDNDQKDERKTMEGDYSRPKEHGLRSGYDSAWYHLGHSYTPIQAVYADLLDTLNRTAGNAFYTVSTWDKKLRNPTPEDIEEIRSVIHWTRSRQGSQSIDASFEADQEDVKKILDFYRSLPDNRAHVDEALFKIELEGRYSSEQDRVEILHWKRNHLRVFNDDEAAREPEIGERTRKILDLDYFNARSTGREFIEVIKRTSPTDLDQWHENWTKILKRFCEGVQGPSIPSTANDGRSDSKVRSEPIEIVNDQEPKCEVLPAGNPEGQRPFELWKTVEMAYREEHPKPLCCAKCTQCIDLRNTKGTNHQSRKSSHGSSKSCNSV